MEIERKMTEWLTDSGSGGVLPVYRRVKETSAGCARGRGGDRDEPRSTPSKPHFSMNDLIAVAKAVRFLAEPACSEKYTEPSQPPTVKMGFDPFAFASETKEEMSLSA